MTDDRPPTLGIPGGEWVFGKDASTLDGYQVLTSDYCSQCGMIVYVERFVRVWGDLEVGRRHVLRPLVHCPNDHWEVQP